MTSLAIDSIKVGDRDRSDLGDIAELAHSIERVGLLHPVVVTADCELVAGDRRLAAVRSLGWTEVPVTVVDLGTVAEVLQAEADENTCRKGLTPYEASRARERRIALLAPKAAAARAQAPGAPRGTKVSSSKLDGEKVVPVGAVRKVAAVGTGYSGSTIDKVDRIRDIAERGVIRQGKNEVPAPAPVVEVAKKALEDVKVTGAAIDRSAQDVAAAVETYVAADPDVQRARFNRAFFKALNAHASVTEFAPEDVAALLDEETWDIAMQTHRTVNDWFIKVREARPTRLRVVGGK